MRFSNNIIACLKSAIYCNWSESGWDNSILRNRKESEKPDKGWGSKGLLIDKVGSITTYV